METLTYTVPGMTCEHCVAAVSEEISALEGVSVVSASLETKHVEVAGDKLDDLAIRGAIEDAGYEAA